MTIITYGMTEAPIDKLARGTVPGMAHFAGTGPKGKYCGDCVYLVTRIGAKGYGCDKYRMMMGRRTENEVPRQTRACKYFENRKVTYVPTDRRTSKRPRT